MKKKGLLISTIIMVVVLVASLTTATYAWFSAEASVSVQKMSLNTKATDGLVIGAYSYNSTSKDYEFQNGSLSWDYDHTAWSAGTTGLGSKVDFTVDYSSISGYTAYAGESTGYGLNVKHACTPWSPSGSAIATAAGLSGTADYVKAGAVNGTSNPDTSSGAGKTAAFAKQNLDYIDLIMGVSASSANSARTAYAEIVFSEFDASSIENLGMAGALHLIVKTGDTVDALTTVIGNGSLGQDLFTGTTSVTCPIGELEGTNTLKIYVPLFEGVKNSSGTWSTLGADQTDPEVVIEIIAWFEGYDSSCVNEYTGVGNCAMAVNFLYAPVTSNTVYTFGSGTSGTLTTK